MANCLKKSLAFTLAETLIVMGIIGIVSALTLPNLNSSTGEKEKVAKVQKLYQNLDDALGRAIAVYGPIEEWFTTDSTSSAQYTRAGERIFEFMKVSKTCGTSTAKGCFTPSKSVKRLDGTNYANWDNVSYYKVITADGTSILTWYYPTDKRIILDIDIDGPNKGPYIFGKDIFEFSYDSDNGLIPAGQTWDSNFTTCFSLGTSCGFWIIQNQNMDYLKADRSGKCPNGTILSVNVTSCK